VEPAEIADQLARRPYAFVLTNSDDRVHVVALRPQVTGATIEFDRIGRSTASDIERNPLVTIVWPGSEGPAEYDAYSLIADGRGEIVNGVLRVVMSTAVLHRPA
jgi:hypothetical protein